MKKDGKKRVWFLLIFCTAVFAAFLVRLYWMQFTMADHYAKKLEQASQTSYTVRIPAARGSIVDRSGTALVQDDTVYDLALCVPAPPDTEMAQTLQTLKELDRSRRQGCGNTACRLLFCRFGGGTAAG